MWKWISVILLCATPLYAQCPGGNCPIQRPPIDIGDLPPTYSPKQKYGPVKQEGNLLSVVRIIGIESPGSNVKGSGTYVNYEGLYCVVTASHVARGTSKLYVVFRNNDDPKTVQGIVLANDQTNDVAVIGLFQHPDDGEDIAAEVAYSTDIANIKNEVLSNYGWGGDDVLNGGSGQITGEHGPGSGLPNSWYAISSYARLGDSGGPIFLPSGKLAGVLWGRDTYTIAVVKPNYVHAQLRLAKAKAGIEEAQLVQPRPLPRQPKKVAPVLPIKPPVLPWRDKIENEIDGIKKAPKAPSVAPPAPVNPAPPKPDIDINITPNKPSAPAVQERKRVDAQITVAIIVAVAITGLVAGVAIGWKKTYSDK